MLSLLLGLVSLSVVLGVPVSKIDRLQADVESVAAGTNTFALAICNGVWVVNGASGDWTQGYLPNGVQTGYSAGLYLTSQMCYQGGGISYRTSGTAVAVDNFHFRCTCPTAGCPAGANPWTNVYVSTQGQAGDIQWLSIMCASNAAGVVLQGATGGGAYSNI